MPNHLHCILHFNKEIFSVIKTIGNAKRFMSYEIVNRLEKENNITLLNQPSNACTYRDKKKGQLHKVFKQSFEAKAFFSDGAGLFKGTFLQSFFIEGKTIFILLQNT